MQVGHWSMESRRAYLGILMSCRRRRQSGDWRSQGLTAGTKRSQATGSVVVGPWDAGPIDFQFARFVGDADIFGMLQANGVDEGVGHVGERDGSTHGDAALACELHEPGDKGADL